MKEVQKYYYYQSIKTKWEITIHEMPFIGKYFISNSDYVNVMKLCKRYHNLAQMYHYNPIVNFQYLRI